ncbi:putative membrane protein [Natranaeroarchaeum sulfidigenes]|uniref:Putative membrane protein n=1 Tax=Natranaeroarchaeum sulfidigenes TaxID=2784880 RepID=A0A897MR88_9EURY|nr:putative membrane protein [Natranaeroarchaeum sulfidigenes]
MFAIVTALIATGVLAVSEAYQDTPTDVETVEDEHFIQDVGEWVSVDRADDTGVTGFYDNETVRNQDGDELNEGNDYEWDNDAGAVRILDTPNTEDGADASIDYSYDQRAEEATIMIGPLATIFEIAGILPLVLAVAAVLSGLGLLSRSVGGGTYGGRR